MSIAERINWLSNLLCDPDNIHLGTPFWKDGSVGVTNGQIAFLVDSPDVPQGADWAVWTVEGWTNTVGNPPAKLKSYLEADLEPGSKLLQLQLPKIEPLNCWANPYRKIKRTCWECKGLGHVTCNYGHEHVCPECHGLGTIQYAAIREYTSKGLEDRSVIDLGRSGLFDGRYLWILQELAADCDLTYKLSFSKGFEVLLFSFEGGKGCVMPIRRSD